jgi:hypothetical protein
VKAHDLTLGDQTALLLENLIHTLGVANGGGYFTATANR